MTRMRTRIVSGLLTALTTVGLSVAVTSVPAVAAGTPGWSAWQKLSGTVAGGLDAASRADGRVDAFGRGTNGRLYQWIGTDGAWSQPARGRSGCRAGVGSGGRGDERVDVACVRADRMWRLYRASGRCSCSPGRRPPAHRCTCCPTPIPAGTAGAPSTDQPRCRHTRARRPAARRTHRLAPPRYARRRAAPGPPSGHGRASRYRIAVARLYRGPLACWVCPAWRIEGHPIRGCAR